MGLDYLLITDLERQAEVVISIEEVQCWTSIMPGL